MATSEKLIVSCRVRPSFNKIKNDCVSVDGINSSISVYESDIDYTKYVFDHVFNEKATQVEIFEKLGKRIVDGCVSGVNGTIFVYGQTGSGKTWTMLGPLDEGDCSLENQGLIQRCINYLLLCLEKMKVVKGDIEYAINAQCIQLYKESLYDLQSSTLQKISLKSRPQGVVIDGASNTFIKTTADLQRMLKDAWRNRIVSETAMNAESSRSHGIFTFDIEIKETIEDAVYVRKSCLNLVDLAGSERIHNSNIDVERLPETGAINKSLLQLGRVIRSLSAGGNSFVAYRDSLLTQLLRDSLGGNARTSVIVNCHPDKRYKDETVSTLNFAMSCRKVVNKARVNEDLRAKNVDVYKNLLLKSKEEIEQLHQEIDAIKNKKDTSRKEYEDLRAVNNNLEKQLLRKTEEYDKLHKQYVKLGEENDNVTMEYQASIADLRTKLSELTNIRSRAPVDSRKNRRRAIHIPMNLNELVEQRKQEALNESLSADNIGQDNQQYSSFEVEELKVEKLRLELELGNISKALANKEMIIEKYENLENEKIQQYITKVEEQEMIIDQLKEKLADSTIREMDYENEVAHLKKILEENSIILKDNIENAEFLQRKLINLEQESEDLKEIISRRDAEIEHVYNEMKDVKTKAKKELEDKLGEQKIQLYNELNKNDLIDELKSNHDKIVEDMNIIICEKDREINKLQTQLSEALIQSMESVNIKESLLEKENENIRLKNDIEKISNDHDDLLVKFDNLERKYENDMGLVIKKCEGINEGFFKIKKEKENLEMQIKSMIEAILNQTFSPSDMRMSVLSSFNSSMTIFDAVLDKVNKMKEQITNEKCQREFNEAILQNAQKERDEWEEKYNRLCEDIENNKKVSEEESKVEFVTPKIKPGTKKTPGRKKKVLEENVVPKEECERLRRSTRPRNIQK